MSLIHRTLFFTASVFAVTAAAHAETPAVTVSGLINFQAGYSDQKDIFEAGTRHQGFRNDTEIHVNVEGKSELGFAYGAAIELEADVTADARGEGLNADKTYLWLEPSWGRFELGNNAGVEQEMAVNAASIARATGGIDGDDEFYINFAGIGGRAAFLFHPDLPSATIGGIAEDATKITFYTPQYYGFQLGLSYTPDEGDGGQFATRSKTGAISRMLSPPGFPTKTNGTAWSWRPLLSVRRAIVRMAPRKILAHGRRGLPFITPVSPSRVLTAIGMTV